MRTVTSLHRAAGNLFWMTTSGARSNGIDLSHEKWDDPVVGPLPNSGGSTTALDSLIVRLNGPRDSLANNEETLNSSFNFVPSVSGHVEINESWHQKI
jgi:hypothetical protein